MTDIIDLLEKLDDGRDPEPDALNTIKPYIRFDWNAAPVNKWPADRHPAGRESWSIKLSTERSIALGEFHQFSLYAGMLAGIPTDHAKFASDAILEANRLTPEQLPLLMLQPKFREFNSPKYQGEPRTKHRALPPIVSVAVFNSKTLASSPGNLYSSLRVIWFQETFGLPADLHILNQLQAIDWEREAESWDP